MKIKRSYYPIQRIFLISLFLIMIFLTIVLCIEYHFFKQQAYRMLELQKDYQDYLYSLKQLHFSKKKSLNEPLLKQVCVDDGGETAHLNVVNRHVYYLRDSALTFGKAHNVEKVVKPLYEGGTWDANYTQAIRNCLQPRSKRRTAPYKQQNMHYLGYDFTLSWPINKSRFWISSHFGQRKKRFHYGIDMAALKGTPVFPALEGTVVEVSYTPKGYGKSIVIDHQRCKTRYAHLDEIFVKVGQKVVPSNQIGCVGDTGLVHGKKDASHLHFEVIDLFGKRLNPLYILE